MAKVNVPPEPSPKTTVYGKFRGVDFSTDPYNVERDRSPYAVNLISDKGGQPEKRVGWRVLHNVEGPVNAMAHGVVRNGGHAAKQYTLIHGGTKLYGILNGALTLLKHGINNAKSSIFFAEKGENTYGFILTGQEYLMFDGVSVTEVTATATVPRVLIGGKPAGGGQVLMPVNLLQPKRIEERAGDGAARLYQLSANGLDAAAVEISIRTASGTSALTEGKEFSVNRALGQITFGTAPAKPPVDGEDNVFITYSKTVDGYAQRVTQARITTSYSVGNGSFLFTGGNPRYPAKDFWSYVNDPTYFPDTYYAVIGNANTRLMNYTKLGQYLILVKETNY